MLQASPTPTSTSAFIIRSSIVEYNQFKRLTSKLTDDDTLSYFIVRALLASPIDNHLMLSLSIHIHTCVRYMQTDVYTYIHSYIHVYDAYRQTYIHTYKHTSIHLYKHTYKHTYIHSHIHEYILTQSYTYIYIHICIHNIH